MISENFRSAIHDYRFLLERNYPQKGIIKLIGDRYSLSGTERTMLYRGITTGANCLIRKSKKALVKEATNSRLCIDGYNVMITIGNYLNGNTTFIGNDHYLRDAAEMHGKVFRKVLMDRVLDLLLTDLKYLKAPEVMVYFDKPVSKSGELAAKVNDRFTELKIKGKALTADSADYNLKRFTEGYIATSDSGIIDQSKVKVFDLALHVIKRNFNAEIIDLRSV